MAHFFLVCAGISGFLSVALGAFAAHALRDRVPAELMAVFRTGVEYQFFHVFAMALVALLLARGDLGVLRASGWCFLVGTVLFSGSLYILALTGTRAWGAVTPFGGTLFLVGWVLFVIAASRMALE